MAAWLDPDSQHADDRGQKAEAAKGKNQVNLTQGCSEDDCGSNRGDVGVEQIGAHAGNVTDIVTDIVGDNGWVARVVLGNTELNFAGQVSGNIGCLGENTATGFGKQGQGAGAKAEREDDLGVASQKIQDTGSRKACSNDGQPHDSSAAKACHEGGLQALASGGG